MDDDSKPVGECAPTTGKTSPSQWWHGAQGLAEALGVPPRRARYLLEKRAIPGAKRVAGRWTGLTARLPEMVEDDVA
jgi:hypothetical protein